MCRDPVWVSHMNNTSLKLNYRVIISKLLVVIVGTLGHLAGV